MKKYIICCLILSLMSNKLLSEQSGTGKVDEKNNKTSRKLNLEYRRNPIELSRDDTDSGSKNQADKAQFNKDSSVQISYESPRNDRKDFSWHDAREDSFSSLFQAHSKKRETSDSGSGWGLDIHL